MLTTREQHLRTLTFAHMYAEVGEPLSASRETVLNYCSRVIEEGLKSNDGNAAIAYDCDIDGVVEALNTAGNEHLPVAK